METSRRWWEGLLIQDNIMYHYTFGSAVHFIHYAQENMISNTATSLHAHLHFSEISELVCLQCHKTFEIVCVWGGVGRSK